MGTLSQNATALLASAAMAGFSLTDQPLYFACGSQFAKAEAHIEGGQRVIYMEASNENEDFQNERILADALMESKDYFLRFGRLDLDHSTIWQAIRDKKLDPTHPYAREIGRPIDVWRKDIDGKPRVVVKAEIFQSTTPNNPACAAADWFWNTMELSPPMVWYPSVAGNLLGAKPYVNAKGNIGRAVTKLRWHSIAMTRNPQNPSVASVSTVPLDQFAKAMGVLEVPTIGLPFDTEPNSPLSSAKITPEKLALVLNSIVVTPSSNADDWLGGLEALGVSPQEGLAVLVAVFDSVRANGA
jgi:hypothetical protein